MPTQLIDQGLIDRNPFDSRVFRDPVKVANIADSIKTHGLLQEPKGRALAADGKTRYQLAYGWTRFEAWKIAKPGEPFPVDVVELDDQQMSVHSYVENDARNDLTQIEKALWLDKHMGHFKLTQAQVARAIEKDTSTISNLLRLLQLPQPIKDLMLKGLPERLARQLIPLSKAHVREACIIADKVFRADESEREQLLDRELNNVFYDGKLTVRLWNRLPPDWKPPQVEIGDELEPKFPTPCQGCAFRTKHGGTDYCLRPACFVVKVEAWRGKEAERIAEELNLTVAKPGEEVLIPIAVPYGDAPTLKAALATKDPALRIVPVNHVTDGGQNSWTREQVLGSEEVMLAATSVEGAERIQALARAESKRVSQATGESERDKREKAARREAHDLVKRAAPAFTLALFPLDIPDVVLQAMFDSWKYEFPAGHDKAVAAFKEDPRGVLATLFLYKQKEIPRYGTVKVDDVRKQIGALAKGLKVTVDLAAPAPKAKAKDVKKAKPTAAKAVAAKVDAGKVDKNKVKWLTGTPAKDVNFKLDLKNANLATLKAALAKGVPTKTAREAIAARVRKLKAAQ
jgi:ParB/RepB/Spo0J family partition protein